MNAPVTHSTVAELVRSFTSATPDGLDAAFQRLVGALWNEGKLTDLALEATPAVVTALDEVGPDRQGHLAVLLGLLAEAEYPRLDGEVATAVRAGLDRYLDLVRGGTSRQPLTLALLYLLAHFPADRDRILAVTGELSLEIEERTRLERGLAELDPQDPDLGRVWPAPSVWAGDDKAAAFAKAAARGLTPQQIVTNWENDTRTLWAYTGALAYWAVRNGPPAPVAVRTVPEQQTIEQPPVRQTDETFGSRAALLRCPTCHGPIELHETGARCTTCATTYPSANGILDLSAGVRDDQPTHEATSDLLQKLTEMPTMGLVYEAVQRPAYLRLAGSNFGDEVTPADEDAYLAETLRSTEGPVVDVAAGAGRWTAVVAEAVGADRLTAVDMLLPMLNVLRGRLPEVPAVRGSALNLPFGDGTVGVITLWNALQAFPDDAATAIAEIGRCLRPGGIFTMMTYRWSDDPIARYFQASHFFPSRPDGHLLFELNQIRQWLADAGLVVRKESSSTGTFVFVTAERTA
ncbi:class I SAM-dependent methyltransferase [Streptosporangium sp. NBC_01756]|uniref:class I SAM-dependent methyltransferase n=1 Tax=Streptosporangium sp. NBC_01756 TaxID=2975950 RepID=UPI002DDA5C31|nr:class I SAM-dependent methyltransferase [Streptosporangium sp. NBC_01756]WSC85390.1 class I SAM-dependent methyltransferase [Streptosporangium sp. NBC_01756]